MLLIDLSDDANKQWLHGKKPVKEMRDIDGNVVVISEFNKNHDKSGRFAANQGIADQSIHDFAGGAHDPELIEFMESQGVVASAGEASALKAYTGAESWWMNRKLRRGKYPSGLAKTAEAKQNYDRRLGDYVKQMDALASRNSTKNSFYAYRGVIMNKKNNVFEIARTFKDQGYVSSSLSRSLGSSFAKDSSYDADSPGKIRYLMKILVPKGTKGILVDPIANYGEAEFIMPRDSTFTITKRTKTTISGSDVTLLDVNLQRRFI